MGCVRGCGKAPAIKKPAFLTPLLGECYGCSTVTACNNIVLDGITLADAPEPASLECQGVHGVASGVGRGVLGPSCHLTNG